MAKAQLKIQQILDVPGHNSLPECTEIIQQLRDQGGRIAQQIAVLVSEAKAAYFPQDYKGWLAWTSDQFGFQPRHAVTCLNAGDLLKAHLPKCPTLAKVGIAELELIKSIGSDRLIKDWLNSHDPRTMSRAEIRESVRATRLIAAGLDPNASASSADADHDTPPTPPAEVPAIPGDEEDATEFMSRLQRLMAFDPRRLDPLKQADYAQAYCIRFQQSLQAQLDNLDRDQLASLAEHVTNFRDGFSEIHATITERLN